MPSGYSEIANIAVDKPGRRLYNIRGPMLKEAVSVLLQIDAAEGNKVITIRSPLQVSPQSEHEHPHLFLCLHLALSHLYLCFLNVPSSDQESLLCAVHHPEVLSHIPDSAERWPG